MDKNVFIEYRVCYSIYREQNVTHLTEMYLLGQCISALVSLIFYVKLKIEVQFVNIFQRKHNPTWFQKIKFWSVDTSNVL